MKILSILLIIVALFPFLPSSADAMCYYNRDSDCVYMVRWRPAAIFVSDKLWTVEKGDRKCDVDSDGKLDLTRSIRDVLSVLFLPMAGNEVTVFPDCTGNRKVEEHGWVSLFIKDGYNSDDCGCGLASSSLPDGDDVCTTATGQPNTITDQANNDKVECLIFDDDGKKIYP